MACTAGTPGCPYSEPQSCTPGTAGCPYSPPQACTGPSCTGGTCRGPDGDQRIIQITSDLRAALPGNQQILSEYQALVADVTRPGSNSGADARLNDLSGAFTAALTTQSQRINELNGLTSMMPCTAGGPPPQGGGSSVPVVPFGFGFSVGGHGGSDHGGSDSGSHGGSDSGSRRP